MKIEFQQGAEILEVEFEQDAKQFVCKVLNQNVQGEVIDWSPPFFTLKTSQAILNGAFYRGKDFVDIHLPQGNFRLRFAKATMHRAATHLPGELTSPMPGKVIQILVKKGDKVKKDDLLMILEAMKMEHKILSPEEGVVEEIYFKEGDRVAQEVELLKLG